MRINDIEIVDTYAEAFGVRYTRLIITAANGFWLDAALRSITGYATSVIGCDAEVGVERHLGGSETPDGRLGAAVLLFGFSAEKVGEAAQHRVGQCILTCPTTACFNGLADAAETYSLGKYLRYFGDGHESKGGGGKSKGGEEAALARELWRIPVMDGEFVIEALGGVAKGVAGGNIILQAESAEAGLAAAERASKALTEQPGVIAPFPGGVCRSGSKVGSKYKGLSASTAEAYCPTLRDMVQTELVAGARCAYEIVIDGVDATAVAAAMRVAIEAAAADGVLAITAGNYGGKLGKFHIRLHELFNS
jgi:formylmethanofuran--tetrahydromethanopterin N-formyltransferase